MKAATHRALTPLETTRIAEALRAHGVRYALVFGSAARDALGAESDLEPHLASATTIGRVIGDDSPEVGNQPLPPGTTVHPERSGKR